MFKKHPLEDPLIRTNQRVQFINETYKQGAPEKTNFSHIHDKSSHKETQNIPL